MKYYKIETSKSLILVSIAEKEAKRENIPQKPSENTKRIATPPKTDKKPKQSEKIVKEIEEKPIQKNVEMLEKLPLNAEVR